MSISNAISDNPVLIKHVRSRLRRQHLIPSMVGVVIICLFILWASIAGSAEGLKEGAGFVGVLILQAALLFLVGTAQVATAVGQSRETGMLDFHRISPQPPLATAIGFVLGAPIREWVLFACTLPFAFFLGLGGPPGFGGFWVVLLVTLVSAFLYHCLGALVGVVSPKPQSAGTGVVTLLLLLNLVGAVGGGLGAFTIGPTVRHALDTTTPDLLAATFYGINLPPFLLALVHQIPLTIFFLIPLVRKMSQDRARPYPKLVAVAFHAVIGLLILGDVWLSPVILYSAPALLVYSLVATGLVLIVAVTPAAGEFDSGVRRAHKLGRQQPGPFEDFASNGAPMALFGAVTLVLGLLCGLAPSVRDASLRSPGSPLFGSTDAVSSPGIVACALTGVFVLIYFGSAKQYFDLRFRRSSSPYFALFLFCLWLVPVLFGFLAGVSGMGDTGSLTVCSLSPLFGLYAAAFWGGPHVGIAAGIITLLVNGGLAILFVVLRRGAEASAAAQAIQVAGFGVERKTAIH